MEIGESPAVVVVAVYIAGELDNVAAGAFFLEITAADFKDIILIVKIGIHFIEAVAVSPVVNAPVLDEDYLFRLVAFVFEEPFYIGIDDIIISGTFEDIESRDSCVVPVLEEILPESC